MRRDDIEKLELLGEGWTARIYRDGGRVYKLFKNMPPGEAQHEADRQKFAADAGLPVPAVHGVHLLEDGGEAIEMDYIAGEPVIKPGMDRFERMRRFEEMIRLQCELHMIDAPALPSLPGRLTKRIEGASCVSGSLKKLLLEDISRLERGVSKLCHGDYHTGNILYHNGKLWIIDWVDATRGDPLADACRTYLLARMYLSRLAGSYLRFYCRRSGVQPDDVLAWLPVVAAARLRERLPEKDKAFLLRLLEDDQIKREEASCR